MTRRPRAAPARAPLPALWEYRVIVLGSNASESETRLNSYGVNGWELVGIGGRYQEAQYAYLKRSRGLPRLDAQGKVDLR